MKNAALLTAIATADQLPSFARSPLFPSLADLLVQLNRQPPPSTSLAVVSSAAQQLLGAGYVKPLMAAFPVEQESWVADGWSLPLSLGYLVRRGFHGEAVALLFEARQTQAAFRSADVGLELLKGELEDAGKEARKQKRVEAVAVYEDALQIMEVAQLGKPVNKQSRAVPVAAAVMGRKR